LNVLKPAMRISIIIHFQYILGILFLTSYNNLADSKGDIHIFLQFSTFVFAATIGLILLAIDSNEFEKVE
jgi:hypothetical protein